MRETSRKPDEVYEVIERLCPSARKLGTQEGGDRHAAHRCECIILPCTVSLSDTGFLHDLLLVRTEIFGRPHNTRPGWMTLGNQLDGVRLYDPDVIKRYADCVCFLREWRILVCACSYG